MRTIEGDVSFLGMAAPATASLGYDGKLTFPGAVSFKMMGDEIKNVLLKESLEGWSTNGKTNIKFDRSIMTSCFPLTLKVSEQVKRFFMVNFEVDTNKPVQSRASLFDFTVQGYRKGQDFIDIDMDEDKRLEKNELALLVNGDVFRGQEGDKMVLSGTLHDVSLKWGIGFNIVDSIDLGDIPKMKLEFGGMVLSFQAKNTNESYWQLAETSKHELTMTTESKPSLSADIEITLTSRGPRLIFDRKVKIDGCINTELKLISDSKKYLFTVKLLSNTPMLALDVGFIEKDYASQKKQLSDFTREQNLIDPRMSSAIKLNDQMHVFVVHTLYAAHIINTYLKKESFVHDMRVIYPLLPHFLPQLNIAGFAN